MSIFLDNYRKLVMDSNGLHKKIKLKMENPEKEENKSQVINNDQELIKEIIEKRIYHISIDMIRSPWVVEFTH